MMHNIKKSAFRKGQYVGYAAGKVWLITKSTSSFGNWAARPQDPNDRSATVFAWRLADMSEKLNALPLVSVAK